jgi:hypothetical protein
MNAGRPNSRSPDFSDEYRELATQLARRIAVMEGVVGVALVGDVALGVADRHSPICLNVYLHARTLRTWHLGEAPLPAGESLYREMLVDLGYLDYHVERDRAWTAHERWQAAAVDVLYDPEGRVAELFALKAGTGDVEIEQAIIAEAAAVRAMLDRATPAWLYRGNARVANACVNRAIEGIARLAWLLNGHLPPDVPWLLARAENLGVLPDNWSARLDDALTARELSAAEAGRRRSVVASLLREIWALTNPAFVLDADPSFIEQARMLHHLAIEEELSLDAYREDYALRLLVASPAFDILAVDRSEQEWIVRFDRARLHSLVQRDLGRFLDHQQRLLRELLTIVDRSAGEPDPC